jgi:hypothetical protein
MRALLLLLLLLWATPSSAQVASIDEYYTTFLAPLARRQVAIFLAGCKLPQGKAIVFFPVGKKQGTYAEFDTDGIPVNGAGVTVGKEIHIDDLMWGVASVKRGEAIARELLKSPSRLILPKDLKAALKSSPASSCRSGA